jgi:hypothetical protein
MDEIDIVKEAEKAKRLGSNYIQPWTAFDLDGTIAEYTTFIDPTHIGKLIEGEATNELRRLLSEGKKVKIFTARASDADPKVRHAILEAIAEWTLANFGQSLPVTCIKDYGMIRLYDDRAIQVEKNTGRIIR